MGMPVYGVNVPAPNVKIVKDKLEKYVDLYRGIRDRKDTVSWRTLIMTTRELLGVDPPDYKKVGRRSRLKGLKLIKQLVAKTYLEPLIPEIEYAVGVRGIAGRGGEDLDLLLVNGRHYPEPLLWTLADFARSQGKNVSVINPVGHYNDGQTRVVGPLKYFRKIGQVVILASTQTQLGGSISVLSNVIRLLRNAEMMKKVDSVDVVIPMFGGSRGHKYNQGAEVGYEVMEASFNAEILALITKEVTEHLSLRLSKVPTIRFSSVDIHNSVYPVKTFNEFGFDFASISVSRILAEGILSLIKAKKSHAPLKLVACDAGAVPRTESLAKDILSANSQMFSTLQLIYIEKKRITAGFVTGAQLGKIEEWKKVSKGIQIRKVRVPVKPVFTNTIIVFPDDMIDTGGTAEKDLAFIAGLYPNSSLKIFTATHPVFSKGFGAIKRIGADAYVLGNTLNWEALGEQKGVEVVDFAEAIYKFIQGQ